VAMKMKRLLKQFARKAGLEISLARRSPAQTMLGLRELPFKTVIDIGANEGQFAAYVRAMFPDAEIYCFEPLGAAFSRLNSWAVGRHGIHLYNVALGDSDGVLEFYHHVDHSASSSLLRTTELTKSLYPAIRRQQLDRVNVRRLDDVVERDGLRLAPLTLVKMDVQGFEDRVIRGAPNTLRRVEACVVEVSADTLYEDQAQFTELVNMLGDVGLRYVGNLDQHYADDGHVVFYDAMFVRGRRSASPT
jgi:FkbM family methyltransferase